MVRTRSGRQYAESHCDIGGKIGHRDIRGKVDDVTLRDKIRKKGDQDAGRVSSNRYLSIKTRDHGREIKKGHRDPNAKIKGLALKKGVVPRHGDVKAETRRTTVSLMKRSEQDKGLKRAAPTKTESEGLTGKIVQADDATTTKPYRSLDTIVTYSGDARTDLVPSGTYIMKDSNSVITDMFSLGPDVIILVGNRCAQALNTEGDVCHMSELELDLSRDRTGSKLDDKSAILFTKPRRLDVLSVTSELQLVRTIALQISYAILKALNVSTLIGVRVLWQKEFDILNSDGIVVSQLQPEIPSHYFWFANYLYVSREKQISVVGGVMNSISCFPVTGKGGFVYNDYFRGNYPTDSDAVTEQSLNEHHHLKNPSSLTTDTKGDFYVSDCSSGIIMKVDKGGNFVKNFMSLRGRGCRIMIDAKDQLYVAPMGTGELYVYKCAFSLCD